MSGVLWSTYRTIIEEPAAKLSVDRLSKLHERFEDQWEGFTWLVAREPEAISMHKRVGNTVYRLAHRSGDKDYGLVDIAVVYTFDDETVTIYDVQAWIPV